MSTPLPSPSPSSPALAARLHREWQHINDRPAVLRRAAGWQLGVTFRTLDDVMAATGFSLGRHSHQVARMVVARDDADRVMARLLVAARRDDLAARVVLQRLLPGLLNRSRRWGEWRRGGSADAFEELVSAAWTVLREFPVERRPTHLAANLLRDAEHSAFGRVMRRLMVHELTPTRLLDVPVETVAQSSIEELVDVVRCAGGLTERESRLVRLLIEGRTHAEVAAALSVSERTVRTHRDAMVQRLRSAVLPAA